MEGASRKSAGRWNRKVNEGASRRQTLRDSWKVDRRRKSKMGRKATPKSSAADESEVGSPGRAGRLIRGDGRRLTEGSAGIQRPERSRLSPQAGPEGGSAAKAGG